MVNRLLVPIYNEKLFIKEETSEKLGDIDRYSLVLNKSQLTELKQSIIAFIVSPKSFFIFFVSFSSD